MRFAFFWSHVPLFGKMAMSSGNLKQGMFNEISKHHKFYIKHDHRNINQIAWLISMGKRTWRKTFLTVGSVHIQYCDLDSKPQVRATYCIK